VLPVEAAGEAAASAITPQVTLRSLGAVPSALIALLLLDSMEIAGCWVFEGEMLP
jgi:hypothetical protein